MSVKAWLRGQITSKLYDEKQVALKSGAFRLAPHLQEIDRLGLYLHIPFCRQICPYCPYNKELFQTAAAERYTQAVLQEIDHYAELVGNRPVTFFILVGARPPRCGRVGCPGFWTPFTTPLTCNAAFTWKVIPTI